MKRMIMQQEMSMSSDVVDDGIKKGFKTEQVWKVSVEDEHGNPAMLSMEEMIGLVNISFTTAMNMSAKLPRDLRRQVHVQILDTLSKEMAKEVKQDG